ncbi:ABC transporter ATP-binding protein [Marinibacterium sp. SX1]|uniref:ABC transporter ATP-binding protein n=1 Tax=Marinibacterium sp. SX1 TaxID=3388424 RepID=UPI003D178EDA
MQSEKAQEGDSMTQLSVQNVSKYYGSMAAVSNLSFDVQDGEVLGIGGPNGAGKTTLFDVISGLTPASEGKILLDGVNVIGARPDQICHRGLLRTFQLNAGFDTMTLRENVLISCYFGRQNVVAPGLGFDRETRRRADRAIEMVGLSQFADQRVGEAPVLHRKLLMLAGAIACDPRILLMDEPAGGLSPQEIEQVIGLMRELRAELNLTIVLIEHVMRFFVALSDRVMIMHHGEKIYEGAPSGLLTDRTVIDVYLGEGASERLKHLVEAEAAHA